MDKMKMCFLGHSNSALKRTSRQCNTTKLTRVYRYNGVKRSNNYKTFFYINYIQIKQNETEYKL